MSKTIAVMALLLLATGCGRMPLGKGKSHDDKRGSEQGGTELPGPTEPIKVDGNVDEWANGALSGLNLPAANADAVKAQNSCREYYDGMVSYAKAMQAIYVKRYMAWARYQLAVGGFKTIVVQPYPMPDGCPNCGNGGGGYPGGMAEDKSSAPEAATASADNASTGAASSPVAPSGGVATEYQTNNQEQGVDETDYVKSNGRYVFAASGNLLRVFDLNGQVVHAAQIAGEYPRGLHLSGDRLVLVTESSVANPYTSPVIEAPYGTPDYWWGFYGYWRQRVWYYQQLTNVHEFKIQDDGKLAPVKDRKYFGSFRDGREIGGTLHLVMQKQLPWNILQTGLNLYLHPAYVGIADEAALQAYAQRVAEANLNAWRSSMFEAGDLMADHQASYKSGHCQAFTRLTSTTADKIVGSELLKVYQTWDQYVVYGPGVIDSIYQSYPVFPTYDQVTSVATIDLQDGREDVLGLTISPVSPSMVYASNDRLVVGNQRYQWVNYWRQLYVLPAVAAKPAACIGDAALCAALGNAPSTGVVPVSIVPVASITQTTNFFDFLTFKLSDEGAIPSGIGTMPGTPINNYAIDAGPTTLRFVVTENQQTSVQPGIIVQVTGAEKVAAINSYQNASKLRVMRADGADWKQAAELPLDVGGYVTGVRFLDKAAFISTGDAGKPLYAVDLTDEIAPKLAGAMPDALRSTYFHPMGDGKTLLALGRNDKTYGLTVAMIDVANLAAPSVLATAELQMGGSNAEYDFKSFRYIPRLGLLVLPVNWPYRLELLAANRDSGFAHFGAVTLQDKLAATYGMGGSPRTMLFDDLLVGVFGNQDVGATLNYPARSAGLAYSKSLQLTYKNKLVTGWPYYWYLEGANEITPKWRSATLLTQ